MIMIEPITTTTAPEEMDFPIAMDIIERFYQLNEMSMIATICTMIDTLSAKYGKDPTTITDLISDAVAEINEVEGAYHPFG